MGQDSSLAVVANLRPSTTATESPAWDRIEWLSDGQMRLDGVHFDLTIQDFTDTSSADSFVLLKNRGCLDAFRELLCGFHPRHVLDIGIFQGGSTVLYDLLFDPEKIVAVDVGAEVPALHKYIAARRRESIVKTFFGQDQADSAAMSRIVLDHFADGIDLVVDDASHQYAQTRAAFEIIFPALRPGGWYVIEDWSWNHWPGVWQERVVIPGAPLSRLVLELVVAQASDGTFVDKVKILKHMAAVRRGPAEWPRGKARNLDDVMRSRVQVIAEVDPEERRAAVTTLTAPVAWEGSRGDATQTLADQALAQLADVSAKADRLEERASEAEQAARIAVDALNSARQAEEARKTRRRLRRAWDGWRGR